MVVDIIQPVNGTSRKLTIKELKQLYKEETGSAKDRVQDALEGKCNVWRYGR